MPMVAILGQHAISEVAGGAEVSHIRVLSARVGVADIADARK